MANDSDRSIRPPKVPESEIFFRNSGIWPAILGGGDHTSTLTDIATQFDDKELPRNMLHIGEWGYISSSRHQLPALSKAAHYQC